MRLVAIALCMGAVTLTATAETDLSKIEDDDARAAAEETVEMLADITEYACVVEASDVVLIGKPGEEQQVELVNRCELYFRLPNLGKQRHEHLKHFASELEGGMLEMYFDGRYWWHYQQPRPGSGAQAADRNGITDPAAREKFIKQREAPKVHRHTLQDFLDAGFGEYLGDTADPLLRPFKYCAIETLTKETETDDVWIFTATPRMEWSMNQRYKTVRLTIGKTDGVLREVYFEGGDQGQSTLTISEVRLNPGLDDSTFVFAPPEGVDVVDNTDSLVKSLQKQRADWESQRPAEAR